MSFKPAAAFAAGLWIGAVVVAAIGAFNLRVWESARRERAPRTTAELAAKEDEIQHLRQERARLTAEAQRLRETVAELKSNLDARTALETRRELRRVPFREPISRRRVSRRLDRRGCSQRRHPVVAALGGIGKPE